jgi:hypothetical protein
MNSSENKTFITIKEEVLEYTFNHDIQKVFDLLKDESLQYPIMKSRRTKSIYTKGQNSYEIGAEFSFDWKFCINLEIKVLDIQTYLNYKMIKYGVTCHQYKMYYEFEYQFNRCTIENNTIFKFKICYPNEGLKTTKFDLKNSYNERMDMIKNFDQYLEKNACFYQIESIMIEEKPEKIFKIVSNWEILKKCVPEICDVLIYEGEPTKVGSVLIMKLGKQSTKLAVSKIEIEESEYIIEFKGLEHEDRYYPKQDIVFKVLKIGDESYLEFKHIYFERLCDKKLKAASKEKQKILLRLKDYLINS